MQCTYYGEVRRLWLVVIASGQSPMNEGGNAFGRTNEVRFLNFGFMKHILFYYDPGTWVLLTDSEHIASIRSVIIGPNRLISYMVTYWDGENYVDRIVYDFDFIPIPPYTEIERDEDEYKEPND